MEYFSIITANIRPVLRCCYFFNIYKRFVKSHLSLCRHSFLNTGTAVANQSGMNVGLLTNLFLADVGRAPEIAARPNITVSNLKFLDYIDGIIPDRR